MEDDRQDEVDPPFEHRERPPAALPAARLVRQVDVMGVDEANVAEDGKEHAGSSVSAQGRRVEVRQPGARASATHAQVEATSGGVVRQHLGQDHCFTSGFMSYE